MTSSLHPITHRIVEFWKDQGFRSRNAFVVKLDISKSNVDRLFVSDKRTGEYPEPALSVIKAIVSAFPDIDLNWLVLGKGEMYRAANAEPITNVDFMELHTRVSLRAENLEAEVAKLRTELRSMKALFATGDPPGIYSD